MCIGHSGHVVQAVHVGHHLDRPHGHPEPREIKQHPEIVFGIRIRISRDPESIDFEGGKKCSQNCLA